MARRFSDASCRKHAMAIAAQATCIEYLPVKLACELYLAAGKCVGYLPEARSAWAAVGIASIEAGVRRIELRMVECVEQLGAKLNTPQLSEAPVLHDGGVKVGIIGRAYCRGIAGSRAEGSVGRVGEGSGVEPLVHGAVRDGVGISGNVRPRVSAVGWDIVAVEAKRDSGLCSYDSRPLPAAEDGIGLAIHVRANTLAAANRKIVDVASHEAVRSIAGIDALLRGKVVVVCRRAVAYVSPALRTLRVVEELRVGVGNDDVQPFVEAVVISRLQRVVDIEARRWIVLRDIAVLGIGLQ